jgi:hypothetical protein
VSVEDDIRYEPTVDDLYEAKLKKCADEGHELEFMVTAWGDESIECPRCERRWTEAS